MSEHSASNWFVPAGTKADRVRRAEKAKAARGEPTSPAFNEGMRQRFVTLAMQLRRQSWQQRKWAWEANGRGDSQRYHEHAARAIRDWRDAREYVRIARNWR